MTRVLREREREMSQMNLFPNIIIIIIIIIMDTSLWCCTPSEECALTDFFRISLNDSQTSYLSGPSLNAT